MSETPEDVAKTVSDVRHEINNALMAILGYLILMMSATRALEIRAFEGSVTRPRRDAFVDWAQSDGIVAARITRGRIRRMMQSQKGDEVAIS